jgi:hypothetical protein
MEAARTSATLVNFYQTIWRNNPEDSHIRANRRENLKSYFVCFLHTSWVVITVMLNKAYQQISVGNVLHIDNNIQGTFKKFSESHAGI